MAGMQDYLPQMAGMEDYLPQMAGMQFQQSPTLIYSPFTASSIWSLPAWKQR